ncbi:hypothetical protein Tco_1437866 [Tanacetum coccineum]
MWRQPLLPPLSPLSAKLMIMALEEYGHQSKRGIRLFQLLHHSVRVGYCCSFRIKDHRWLCCGAIEVAKLCSSRAAMVKNLEESRYTLLKVSEPLRAMVMEAPLWDARHQNYDCPVLRHNALRPKRVGAVDFLFHSSWHGVRSIRKPLSCKLFLTWLKMMCLFAHHYLTPQFCFGNNIVKEPQVVDEFIDVCDGSMIRSECLESHVRDELNKTASRTMVVLHPLKVCIFRDVWDFGKLHWVVKPSLVVDPLKVEVRLIVENLRTGFEDLNPESKWLYHAHMEYPLSNLLRLETRSSLEGADQHLEKLLITVQLHYHPHIAGYGIMDLFALVSRNGHCGEEGITRTLSLHFTAASFLMVLDHDTCSFCYNHLKSYTACICCQHVERSLKDGMVLQLSTFLDWNVIGILLTLL